MSNYPAKMAAVIADIITVDGDGEGGTPAELVFLNAFAILKVDRIGRGFRFEEFRQLDETGTASAALLRAVSGHSGSYPHELK